jgi:hypothetical protein
VSGDDFGVRPAEPSDGDAVAGLLGALGYPTSAAEARARMARLERVEGPACSWPASTVPSRSEARRLGCFRVEVTCRPDRREARRLYERCGFSERPRRSSKELG